VTNHPNRNWRRHMEQAADQWLSRWPWKTEPGMRMLTEDDLRALMRLAYLVGYQDGRRQS
jgi:hypothetical protein